MLTSCRWLRTEPGDRAGRGPAGLHVATAWPSQGLAQLTLRYGKRPARLAVIMEAGVLAGQPAQQPDLVVVGERQPAEPAALISETDDRPPGLLGRDDLLDQQAESGRAEPSSAKPRLTGTARARVAGAGRAGHPVKAGRAGLPADAGCGSRADLGVLTWLVVATVILLIPSNQSGFVTLARRRLFCRAGCLLCFTADALAPAAVARCGAGRDSRGDG